MAYGAQFGVLGALIWGWPAYSFILAAGGMAAVVKRVAAAGQDARAAGDGSPPRPAALAHDGGTVPAPVPSDAESAALAALDPRGRAHPWHWRPGWQRGAVRLGAILLAAAVTWGALFHPGGTIGILAIVTAAGVRYTGWRLYRLARRWRYPGMGLARHHPQPAQVRPGHVDRSRAPLRALLVLPPPRRALTDKIGAPPTRLKIEPDRSRVEVGAPAEFTGRDVEHGAVIRAVTAKLAIPDAERIIQKLLRRPTRAKSETGGSIHS